MRECDIFDGILHHALFRKKVHFCARIKCEIVHLHKMAAYFEGYELAKLYIDIFVITAESNYCVKLDERLTS